MWHVARASAPLLRIAGTAVLPLSPPTTLMWSLLLLPRRRATRPARHDRSAPSTASSAEGAALRSEIGRLEAALSDAAVEQQERMRAEQDAQLHALQESAAASLTVSEASGAEGAALRSEIGRLEAALSDAASEHAAAIEASATEGAALRSEIGRLEAVLSEAAASMYPATQWQ